MEKRLISTCSLLFRAALLISLSCGITGGVRAESGEAPIVLTLERAVGLGLESDEALRQAAQAVEAARGQVVQAKSYALPHLSLSGQYGYNFLKPSFFLPEEFREGMDAPAKVEIGEDNDFMGAATLTQVLWAAGRVSAGLNAAREYLESFRYQEIAITDFVSFSVQEAYYSALLGAEMLSISEQAMRNAEEAVRIARAGFDQGTVSRFDVMRAEVEVENRRAPLVVAQNDYAQSLTVLRRRLGLEQDREIVLADSLGVVPYPADVGTYIRSMRETSAEIKTLDHYRGAREQYLRIAKAERYPVLNLTAFWGLQTQWSGSTIPDEDLIAYNAAVQVGFNIPIFDGLNAKGKINEAKANLRSAELELEKAAENKELSVRQSWLMLENALIALDGRIDAVELAEEAFRLAVVRLENGLATPLERLDAELALTTARGQLAQALYACNMAQAYLELAVGSRGFQEIRDMQE